ncbi:GNAT family N-acetyltransferase, partial [Sinorhizobium meliloti]
MTVTPLSFRAMNDSDLELVCQIEQDASAHPWKAKHFIDSLNSGYQCVVAEMNGQIIGYGILMLVLDEASLIIITVAKPFQGKGLGRQLLEQLQEVAVEHQCDTMLLEVRESNQA